MCAFAFYAQRMRLIADRIEIPGAGVVPLARRPTPQDGTTGFAVGLTSEGSWGNHLLPPGTETERWSWWVAEDTSRSQRIRSVSFVLRIVDVVGPLRMMRHAYQSWTPCDVATFGIDRDPSLAPGSIELVRGIHQADQRVVADEFELRSEWLTLLTDDSRIPILLGFEGGERHDGTFRLRRGREGIELWCEAFLGDLELSADTRLDLHGVLVASGATAEGLLSGWASHVGARARARVDSSFQVGWCSWYHYFHDVTERDIAQNLSRADDWPFEVFQIDDGYQSAIGDWLTTNAKFPSELAALAFDISTHGRRPGLWIAPFLAAPNSEIASRHPEWLARDHSGEPLITMFNPPWAGGLDGFMYGLDTTNDEVLAHLESLASSIVSMGFTYLKLDFTFAPSFDGVWSDSTRTPAQRVRAGFDAIRRGAGDDAFLLGCGSPLANVVGVVDGNRIGADVAPSWPVEAKSEDLPGYEDSRPSTRNAWNNAAMRSFMHRRLWLNDPDCLMLRSDHTELGATAAQTWARAVGVSGGMAIVSDDLALLDATARALLDEALDLGRTSDEAARHGRVASVPDLLESKAPSKLRSPAGSISIDLESGSSDFESGR